MGVTGSLYLDEDVSLHLVPALERLGHEVTTTRGERRLGAPDPHQLFYAAERGWTIVTHNRRDFRLLHDAWLLWSRRWGVERSHSGILVLKPYAAHPADSFASAISKLLNDSDVSLASSLYEWQRSNGWVRFLG